MYKTKLQELCQQRQWGLPKYSSMKDGPDHNPRFKASVSVNGLSFDSPFATRSSKDAQNDAAKLAFLHFTSSSSNSNAEPDAGEPNIEETNALGVIDGVQCQYKSQLQNYAQSKNYGLPVYSSKCEGPAHALRFKATVTVDGRPFESPDFYTTLKEAEHAAAKAALMSLSLDGFQEEGSGVYKSLLQELAQREDFSILYKTIKSGASHMPTFFSSVEVEGEVFYGKAGKSKKEAEKNAAKAAYAMLKERALSRSAALTSLNPVPDDSLTSTPSLELSNTIHAQQNLSHDCQLLSSPTTKIEEHAEGSEDEVQEVNSTEIVSTNANVNSEDFISSAVISHMDKITGNPDSSSCSGSVPDSPKEGASLSPTPKLPDVSSLQISDSNVGKATGTRSYLLCNRVRVYPYFPDIAFPKGITVLPISDDRWVAVSLEFPNEKGN